MTKNVALQRPPIWEVAERMNFANPSFFSKFFKGEVGMTPGEYRNGK